MLVEIKKRSHHRARIIEGQFKALVKAIDDDKYCMDIITQSLAIQKSLLSLNKLVLESHMRTHVKDGMQNGSSKEQEVLINELLQLYELGNVRS